MIPYMVARSLQSHRRPLVCTQQSSLISDSSSILANQNVEQLVLPMVPCSSKLWDLGILDVHCIDSFLLLSTAQLSCLFVPTVRDSLGHGLEFSTATQSDPRILHRHGRATTEKKIKCQHTSADMQLLPCRTHHGCGLMLLGNHLHNLSFKVYSLEDHDACVQHDYVVGCSSARMDTQVHRPWDPGGYVVTWYHVTGLRTSHNLRG